MTRFSLNFYDFIILFGIFQAFVFGSLLFLKKENQAGNRFLVLLLFELAFNAFIFLVVLYGWYDKSPWLHILPFGAGFIIGPTFYFYTKTLIDGTFRFSYREFWAFLLILLNYPHSIYHLIYGRKVLHLQLHYFLDDMGHFALIPVAIYLFLSYRLIREYQNNLPHRLSNLDRLTLQWLKTFILGCSLLSLVFLGYAVANLINSDLDFLSEYWVHLSLVVGILWLGLNGISLPEIMPALNLRFNEKQLNLDNVDLTENITLIRVKMEEEKLFLYPDLSLYNLAEKTGLSPKEISLALNKGLGQNFHEFVNIYRVNEVKKHLIDPENKQLTILGIAQNSGFKSKATFNRIFKKYTGLTPNEFRGRFHK